MPDGPAIIELRQYTLHPGRRDELIALFEREFFDSQQAVDIRLEGLFRDPDRPDMFIWMRSFADMESRHTALSAFYDGSVWREHRDAANATMIDSDDVLLLRGEPLDRATACRGPLFCAVYLFATSSELGAFSQSFAKTIKPLLRERGATVRAMWTTEPTRNTFTRLPVRENDLAFVALVDGAERALIENTKPTQLFELLPTARSPLQFQTNGKPGDFAFLNGSWKVRHRIRRERLRDCDEWDEIDDRAVGYTLLNGIISVDEIGIGERGKGSSFRHLDLERGRWSIYWVNSLSGKLFPPVHGGFDGDGCELFGTDREGEREVFVRYKWSGCSTSEPRWEQAFSIDGGRHWETNWIMQFSRAQPSDAPA